MNVRKYLAVAVATAAVSAFAAAAPAHAAVGDITTIAGTGTSGYAGDDALATAATLNTPYGIATDSAGNVYITDYNNNRIRKIAAATGIITTVAGTGANGFSGDSGLATAAQLSDPLDVAVDAAGNLYIADNNNNRVRKVTAATGIITTIAGTGVRGSEGDGGLATAANLNGPIAVTLDGAGNLYVADYEGMRIRKIAASTGIITAVVGTGTAGYSGDGGLATAAQLDGPQDVTADGAGNLYISDYNNARIRKVVATTGIITTVAGTGSAGFSGDGGLATAAQIGEPGYLALDGAGDLYLADYDNNRIRKVTAATGIITTVAGTGAKASSGDGGPATAAELNGPWAVAVNTAGDLFINDYSSHSIRKVTGIATPFTLPPTGANTNVLVWLATALLGAGAVLVTTRRLATGV